MESETDFSNVTWSRPGLLEGNARGQLPWDQSWWSWIAPVILLPLLAILTMWAASHIESDVEQAAQAILESNDVDTSRLSFHGTYRDVEVRGLLPDGIDAATIVALLESQTGPEEGETIRTASVTALSPADEGLGVIDVDVTSDGALIRIRGTVPSQDDKNALLEAAASTGLELLGQDEITVSGLEPASADAAGQIAALTSIVDNLHVGTFTRAELNVGDDNPPTGNIEASDAANAAALVSIAGPDVTVFAAPELGRINTEVTFDGTRIVLSGTVITNSHSLVLADAARQAVGTANVVNNLAVSNLDPESSGSGAKIAALAAVIDTFSVLTTADAAMNDTDLTVNAEAPTPRSAAIARTAVSASEAAGLRPGGELTVVEPPDREPTLEEEIDLLQAELDLLQDEIRENVVFSPGSNTLSADAQSTLNKVVDAMIRHPRAVVEVGGHTDSEGPDAFNLDLSQQRADAVVAYVSESIDATRLTAVGFGEAAPIADNNTEEGRLQNRRVEFIAKESF